MKLNSVFHNAHGFEGYEAYTCSESNGYAYLWDEDQIAELKSRYNWKDIFAAPLYIQDSTEENSSRVIEAPAIEQRNPDLFSERVMRPKYNHYVAQNFDPKNRNNAELLSIAQSFEAPIQKQLNLQVAGLEEIDAHLVKVLKVFCYETEKQLIKAEADQVTFYHFIYSVSEFYKIGIRQVCNVETIIDNWVPKCLHLSELSETSGSGIKKVQYPVPREIVRSLNNAVILRIAEKERLLNAMPPLVEKLIHLQKLQHRILNEEPVMQAKGIHEEHDIDERIENATGKSQREMLERKKKNLPLKEAVINSAVKTIKELNEPFENHLAESGNFSRKFYMSIQRKNGNNGNTQRWLNENKDYIYKKVKYG